MEPIFVETTLDVRDWDAYQRYIRTRVRRRPLTQSQILGYGSALLLSVIATLAVLHLAAGRASTGSMVLGVFLGIGLMWGVARVQSKAWSPAPDSSWLTPAQYWFDASGIRAEQKGQGQVGLVEWRGIRSVDDTPEHLFLAVSEYSAYMIPKRSLGAMPPAELVARIRAWHAQHGPKASGVVEAGSTVESGGGGIEVPAFATKRRFWRDLARNLAMGTRMFFLMRADASNLSTGFGHVVALLFIAVLVHLSFDVSQIKETSDFYYWSFYTWFTCVVLVIWVSALVTRVLKTRVDSSVMIVAALAMAPWAIMAFWVISQIPDPFYVIFPVLVAVVVFVLGMRVTRVVHGTTTFGTFLIMMVTATLIAVAIDKQFLYARLWPDYGGESGSEVSTLDADWQAAESLLFDQSELIGEAVDTLAPERPDVADVFFVGFAGDGSERVFRREALFAEKVFAERMGSGERSIELINDEDDRITYPLGSAAGLRHALIRIAARMNVEEDILVLMLTSHGSTDDGIHVGNGNLPLNSVEPEAVLRALDAAGIKWRIVIVSACYSGTFIKPLESENTMVITASDADSTSFGCADDRDLTYFGEAFLRDALPKATSLEAAFDTAREAIANRERAEKLDPSNPQIFVGDALREKLVALGKLPLRGVPAP